MTEQSNIQFSIDYELDSQYDMSDRVEISYNCGFGDVVGLVVQSSNGNAALNTPYLGAGFTLDSRCNNNPNIIVKISQSAFGAGTIYFNFENACLGSSPTSQPPTPLPTVLPTIHLSPTTLLPTTLLPTTLLPTTLLPTPFSPTTLSPTPATPLPTTLLPTIHLSPTVSPNQDSSEKYIDSVIVNGTTAPENVTVCFEEIPPECFDIYVGLQYVPIDYDGIDEADESLAVNIFYLYTYIINITVYLSSSYVYIKYQIRRLSIERTELVLNAQQELPIVVIHLDIVDYLILVKD